MNKIEVQIDIRSAKSRKLHEVSGNRWSQQVEHMQVPNWRRPRVQNNKCPQLACQTHRKCFIDIFHNSIIGQFRQ